MPPCGSLLSLTVVRVPFEGNSCFAVLSLGSLGRTRSTIQYLLSKKRLRPRLRLPSRSWRHLGGKEVLCSLERPPSGTVRDVSLRRLPALVQGHPHKLVQRRRCLRHRLCTCPESRVKDCARLPEKRRAMFVFFVSAYHSDVGRCSLEIKFQSCRSATLFFCDLCQYCARWRRCALLLSHIDPCEALKNHSHLLRGTMRTICTDNHRTTPLLFLALLCK